MRWLLIVFLVTSCSSCAAPVSSRAPTVSSDLSLPAPEGWVLYPSPRAESPALRCANYSMREWRVTTEGENLTIRLDTRRDHQDPLPPEITSGNVAAGSKGDRRVIRVEDGWLVGLDEGEFGGALWWFSSDGKMSKKLADENVVDFARSSKGVLALVGLAHLGFDSGKVLRIAEGEAGNRRVEVLTDLGAAPRAFAAESSDSLLVLTTRGLVRVGTSGTLAQLLPTNYGLLYPNSMTRSPSGVIHVGMRHFLTRLTPTGNSYREEWFVPLDCSKFRVRDYDCVCISSRK